MAQAPTVEQAAAAPRPASPTYAHMSLETYRRTLQDTVVTTETDIKRFAEDVRRAKRRHSILRQTTLPCAESDVASMQAAVNQRRTELDALTAELKRLEELRELVRTDMTNAETFAHTRAADCESAKKRLRIAQERADHPEASYDALILQRMGGVVGVLPPTPPALPVAEVAPAQ